MEGLQALAELAIALVRLTGTDRAWDVIVDRPGAEARWREHIVEQVSMAALAQLPRKRPMQAFPYLLPYLVLRRTGFRDPYYEQTLDRLMSVGFPDMSESVPYRRLDVAYFLGKSGRKGGGDLKSHYRRTGLAHQRSVVLADDDSAYALTHTILYLSDFGAQPIALPEPELRRIQPIIETLVVHYWRERHWDLVGELLLCSEIVGRPPRSLAGYAYKAFQDAHWEDGTIPGHADAGATLLLARDAGETARVFSGVYHTTIVSLILATKVIESER